MAIGPNGRTLDDVITEMTRHVNAFQEHLYTLRERAGRGDYADAIVSLERVRVALTALATLDEEREELERRSR